MLTCLTANNLAEYKKLEHAKTSDVKVALLKQGVTVDGHLGKEALLEKLYLVLFKKSLSEKGTNNIGINVKFTAELCYVNLLQMFSRSRF
jgi:hypothetical protein